MTYFVDINPECIYYDDLILFFYKIFNNSDILLNYIMNNCPNIIKKILKISFDIDNSGREGVNFKRKINTRLIMIKLLCQIIEKIENDDLKELSTCLQILEKENIVQNPLIFLYEKLMKQLKNNNNNNNNLDLIIYKYYTNLSFICLNKIYELEEDEEIIKNLIFDESELKSLFYSDNFINLSENQFFVKMEKYSNDFEKFVMLNQDNNKHIKSGKIICFIGNNLYNYFINDFADNEYINLLNQYNESSFIYDSYNKNNTFKYALIITTDTEQLDFYNISDIELKNINQLEMINNESRFKKTFLENNYKLVIDIIKKELFNSELNLIELYEKLKLLSQVVKYIKKDDLKLIIEFLWKFYDKNKSEENEYPFMSLEYIEKETNKYFNLLDLKNNNKNVILENNGDSIFSLFNYIIKDKILEINRNLGYINKNYKINLNYPHIIENLNEGSDDIKKIYASTYKLSNLSFYMSEDDISYEIINDNSILFKKIILSDNDITSISKIIKLNLNKIKVILVYDISININQNNLISFIKENGIPIYIIEKYNYLKIINFFLRGEGEYIYIYKNNQYNGIDFFNSFTIFQLKLKKQEKQEENSHNIRIENMIKNMPKFKLNNIINNSSYKTELCKY